MPLNTIEKQIADKYLKRYLQNLNYNPEDSKEENSQIANEILRFKSKQPKYGYYLELKFLLGKTDKEIQNIMGYARTQMFVIQSQALSIFANQMKLEFFEHYKQTIISSND